MNLPEILLLGPGPSPVPPEVLSAQAAPLLGHLDPAFLSLMEGIQADLRTALATANPLTLPISGTGSAGMEACLVNLVEHGDRVVIGVNGVFGKRMAEIGRRAGGEVVEVEVPFGRPLDLEEMQHAIDDGPTRIVGFVHAETSTGVLQPLDDLLGRIKEAGALSVVDCVTSFCGAPIQLDALGIDCLYSGTQKCLSVPPGLAPVSFGPRAMAKVAERASPCPSWYLDLSLLGSYWGSERVYHHTAPIAALYGLATGLGLVLAEGLEARWQRHTKIGNAFWQGLTALGLEPAVEAGLRTPMLTSIRVPDGVDELNVRKRLRDVYQIEIGGGLGEWKGRVWRVGLMGHGARMSSVVRVLSALADALNVEGKSVSASEAIAEAERAFGD